MFTEQQLKTAHSKVKSGVDFPGYIREVKKLGLVSYEFSVRNGQTIYYGENGYKVQGAPRYNDLEISLGSSEAQLKQNIAIHQQGQTDFQTFCKQAAEAGVAKWVIDTRKMLCTYYNLSGEELLAEPVPQGDY